MLAMARCQCPRYAAQPCQQDATQEDLACDDCRARRCYLVFLDDERGSHGRHAASFTFRWCMAWQPSTFKIPVNPPGSGV
jgi:hypothetical protein